MATITPTRRGKWVAEKIPGAAGWQARHLDTGASHWAANKTAAVATMHRLADKEALRVANERLAAAAARRAH
jgi:hypothetical protein